MRPSARALLTTTLALSLWLVADGIRCLQTGAFAGRVFTAANAHLAEGVLVEVEPGRFVEYGLWAWPLDAMGIHPNALAPFFVGLGVFGFFSLAAFLFKRGPLGWAGLVAFSVVSLPYFWPGTVLAAISLAVLLLPSTRERAFSAPEGNAERPTAASEGSP